ncbi:hypothetical protein SAMN05216480_10658 [Pustulibacterium marinum]|uniref:YhhN-like protein n=1 Tax=Pustulibacterium marinum TaxID=1224947 RepID=A0A1I7GWX9_9FLAO|nr:hypothetical protein SAMN05216480_10658 [Pustulibacterium marinum]
MITNFLSYFLNREELFIKLCVFSSLFFLAFSGISYRKKTNKLLLGVVGISSFNEVLCSLIQSFEGNIAITTNVVIVTLNILWFYILYYVFNLNTKKILVLPFLYLIFSFYNTLSIEGLYTFNYHVFISGSLLYVLIFIILSFYYLKEENFSFYLSNEYLLILAPLLFFIGASFLFGFKDSNLTRVVIFKSVTVYTFIMNISNFICYTLINIYIYRERKQIAHAS